MSFLAFPAWAALTPGIYEGLLDTGHGGPQGLFRLVVSQKAGAWEGVLAAVAKPDAPPPMTIPLVVDGRLLSLSLPSKAGALTCKARIAKDALAPVETTPACRLSMVTVAPQSRASGLSGAWRAADGRIFAVATLADWDNPLWVDYNSGRWNHLFDRGDELQGGSGFVDPRSPYLSLKPGRDGSWTLKSEGRRRVALQRVTFREEPIAWTNAGIELRGTLILPEGEGPFPAVVLTQMSAPAARDGYRLNAYFFAHHGIASLIYDRRGLGESGGKEASAGMRDLADDAVAGAHALQARADIRRNRVGVWGHSQGGWIAPIAAARSKDIAFVIAQSAPAVTAAEQEIFRVENVARSAGLSDADIAEAVDYEKRLMEWVRSGQGRAEILALSRHSVDKPWASFVELRDDLPEKPSERAQTFWYFDPVPDFRTISVPVLGLFGEKDSFVPVARSVPIFREALAAGGAPQEIHVFPSTAHGLWTGPDDSLSGLLRSRGFHPDYWSTMGRWLKATAATK
ncbi:alpha/beta hydrolase family protein [Tahibacter amnicola]|uniref:Alpha/beta fold hydrolase n=1 Tax=Tahibacter amnicola TaxID=2976241 RepID=A0ABY6BJZ0_9GAMM|nr:alpha/beta fold hydrolase [Tahibacter amnicola]UXI70082.1 alpha/beta fold hydrolase [Tahibacter amnicola]